MAVIAPDGNEIEVNENGLATCDFCKQERPAEEMTVEVMFHNYPDSPDDLGQICMICRQVRADADKAEADYYESLGVDDTIDDDLPTYTEELEFRESEAERVEVEHESGGRPNFDDPEVMDETQRDDERDDEILDDAIDGGGDIFDDQI